MRLTEFYRSFSAGVQEPSVIRLADALSQSAPMSKITEINSPAVNDVQLTGHYRSLEIGKDIHYFSADIIFDTLFQTSGFLPRGMWVGAIFSGMWRSTIDGKHVTLPSDGQPRIVATGQRSRFLDQPEKKHRIRMSSFLLSDTFFERVSQDDPSDQFAGLRNLMQPGVSVHHIPDSARLLTSLQKLLNNPYCGTTGRLYVESIIMASVFDLAGQYANDLIHLDCNTGPTLAYEARTVIDGAPEKFTSIADLAHQLGSNETSLQRQFRKAFKVTIFEYVLGRRMQSARVLVHDGQLQISEIAYCVGYSSPANFSTAYKRYFGCSPAQDRAAHLS